MTGPNPPDYLIFVPLPNAVVLLTPQAYLAGTRHHEALRERESPSRPAPVPPNALRKSSEN